MVKNKQDILKELMNKYNEYREKWITQYGNDVGFNAWFTSQVIINK